MPVKERLNRVSLSALVPFKIINTRVTLQEDSLASKPFIAPKRKTEHKFTGRRRELDYLRTLYSEVLLRLKKQKAGKEENHRPIIAAIKGEAGIGKSRLAKEFIARIKANSGIDSENVFYGYALSSGQNSYGLFGDAVKHVNEKNKLPLQNIIKEFIFRQAVELNSHGIPLVIMLEDMQWADEPSLAALEHIARTINLYTDSNQPQIFFILNSRPGFKPSKTLRAECDYREIGLNGFNENESDELISNIIGRGLKPRAKELIEKRSDGNPFNIEEWCSLLHENKGFSKIPDTVKALLVERVLNLESSERAVIIIASVLGRKFELRVLNEILKRAGKEHVSTQTISQLIEKRFLVNLSGDVYEFRHDILQETIYSHLRINVKQDVHLLAGNAIEELFPARLSEYYYELARHYISAKSVSKTIEYLEKAGDKAKDNYEHNRALGYYEKLLKLIDKDKNYNIIFKMCDVYMNRSEWNKQIELCKNILAESLRLDKNIKAECYKRIGHALRLKGDYKNALKIYKKAYRIYEISHDVEGKLDIMIFEARVIMDTGKYYCAQKEFEILYSLTKRENFPNQYKHVLGGLGVVYSKVGNYKETIKCNRELFELALKTKDNNTMLSSKINEAQAYYFLGEYDYARKIYISCLKIALKHQSHKDLLLCKSNIGAIYYAKNNYKKALRYFNTLIKDHILLDDKIGLCRTFGMIGACLISMGNYKSALRYLNKQLQLSKELNRKQTYLLCLSNIGAINNLMGNFHSAIKIFKKQEKLDSKTHNWEGVYRSKLNQSMAIFYMHKYNKAKKYAEQAIDILNSKKLGHNSALALWHLSRIFYETKQYKKAKIAAKESFCNSAIANNGYLSLYLNLLIYKIDIIDIMEKNSNPSYKFEVTRIFNKIYQTLKTTINIEEIGLIYYVLWEISILIYPHIIPKDGFHIFRKKALYYYSKLYKKAPQYEFQLRIKLLNSVKIDGRLYE